MNSQFSVISTFSGCGGSSLGYELAGGKILLAVEFDRNAIETYKLNFPETPIYEGDIKELTVGECLQITGLQVGELDVLDGSPPCQGFSTAGKRDFRDERNWLFKEYVRLLEGLQPKIFVMENVSGLVKGKMKMVFAEIMRSLKGAGYKVRCRLMNAMYYGVPQQRQRVIFIGVRNDLGLEPSHPRPQTPPTPLRAICPDALASRSQKINPWIPSWKPVCTITKTPFKGLIKTGRGVREPTLEELKIFGSFPKDFKFAGGKQQAWERIGNSVPPLLMKAIAEHIRDNILLKIK